MYFFFCKPALIYLVEYIRIHKFGILVKKNVDRTKADIIHIHRAQGGR